MGGVERAVTPPAERSDEPARASATIRLGILAFRWAALAWMTVLAATSAGFRRPALAWAALAVAAAWTAASSLGARSAPGATRLAADLALACALVVVSGFVVADGAVLGRRPFFATAYPAAAVLAWAAARGLGAGVAAGLAVGLALVASRPANGVALGELSGAQVQSLVNAVVTFLFAGGAVGLVSRLLERSGAELRRALDERMRETQRAARLAEREALARQIHDSVLQALALVHKRGRELAAAGPADPAEIGRLAELAGAQEQALRALVLRTEVEPPAGAESLRDRLEGLARGYAGRIAVGVSAAGPAFCARHAADEIAAAVGQAIDNAVEHAGAGRVTVFVDERDGDVAVSVRDDGAGFDVAAATGYGLRSMRGRIEDLGGRFTISSAAGRGTEVEMIVPARGER